MTAYAGVAQCEISPGLGVELGGYPYFDRANSGVHDPLVASALFLDDGRGETVLLVATDLFWITREQGDRIRGEISSGTGIDPERIFVTCSHTHSAPWMSVIFEAGPDQPQFETRIDSEYIDFVTKQLVNISHEAMSSAFAAGVGYARVQCGKDKGIGGNRRHPDVGPVDSDVPVLVVFDASGSVRAVWTKYAMHPTILHGENTEVSADFPGAIRAEFAEQYPEAVLLYSMGTAGDQSPRYFSENQSFQEADRYGRTIGRALVEAVRASSPTDNPNIAVASSEVDLVAKTYEEPELILEKVKGLRATEATLIEEGASYVERQTANLWLLGAECDYNNSLQERDGRLEARYASGTPYTVSVLVVSGIAWVFLPGEIFVEFGQMIQDGSPFLETNVVTLTNGHLPGYCVTQEALNEGGYEPGNSILAAESGVEMARIAIRLLQDLAGSGK